MTSKAKHVMTGYLGEDIAEMFLRNKGFEICDRNYRKTFGEIDIVAKSQGELFFFEVKSSCASEATFFSVLEHIHEQKRRRLKKSVEAYLHHMYGTTQIPCRVYGLGVLINEESKVARVKMLEVIL